MLEVVVELARNSQSDSTRLAAATQLLDRTHGKPAHNKLAEPIDEIGQIIDETRLSAWMQQPEHWSATHEVRDNDSGRSRREVSLFLRSELVEQFRRGANGGCAEFSYSAALRPIAGSALLHSE